jgi:integrase
MKNAEVNMSTQTHAPAPWNKGKAIGQKAPFSPEQVAMLKALLAAEGNLRDLALFSVALDTLLRASNLVTLTVADVQDGMGQIRKRVTLRPKKIRRDAPPRPHVVELSEYSREVLARWIAETKKRPHDPLFTRRRGDGAASITTRTYRNLVKRWAGLIKADPSAFSTHSLRRTRSAYLYARTRNLAACQHLLGHQSITSTAYYLGVDREAAFDLAREHEL